MNKKEYLGYDAVSLYRIIGVTRDVFNRWKRLLDVDPKRNKFSEGDLIAYWAIYKLVGDNQHPISVLSGQSAWSAIFDACYDMPLAELEQCRLIYYWKTKTLDFLRANELPSDHDNESYRPVSFRSILEAYRQGQEKMVRRERRK